jgi:hypothetical protein
MPIVIRNFRPAGTFDGMIDVRTARDQRVTPLAIITDGIVA